MLWPQHQDTTFATKKKLCVQHLKLTYETSWFYMCNKKIPSTKHNDEWLPVQQNSVLAATYSSQQLKDATNQKISCNTSSELVQHIKWKPATNLANVCNKSYLQDGGRRHAIQGPTRPGRGVGAPRWRAAEFAEGGAARAVWLRRERGGGHRRQHGGAAPAVVVEVQLVQRRRLCGNRSAEERSSGGGDQ